MLPRALPRDLRRAISRPFALTDQAALLAGTAAMAVSVLLFVIGALHLWREVSPPTPQPARSQEGLSPNPLHVMPLLAGEDPAALAQAALSSQDDAAWWVILTHSLQISPQERIRLSKAYLESHPEATLIARRTARMLYHTAVLHPYLSDTERLDALLFLAPRWEAWGDRAALAATARSLAALASTSRSLRAGQRQRAYTALRQMGFGDLVAPLSALPPGPAALPARLPMPFPNPELPDDVRRAQEARVRAAQLWWRTPHSQNAQQRLAAALQAEDLARETFYDRALAATPTPLGKATLAWDRIRWRHMVLLVAEGQHGIGLSLMPQWEAAREGRTVALVKAWESLMAYLVDYVAAQPDILAADQGRFELWSWLAWAGEAGLYPRYPWPYIVHQLTRAQSRFLGHPDAPVRPWVVLDQGTDPPWYVLTVPRE